MNKIFMITLTIMLTVSSAVNALGTVKTVIGFIPVHTKITSSSTYGNYIHEYNTINIFGCKIRYNETMEKW